ncbi:MAG: glycosyltransferase family 2 protein [Deltaproteobacteria bacterium]|nr:glycosyltransferase family 2 protein [Deltaproteobacteria bacterium]
MAKFAKISVVIPAFNEEPVIGRVIREVIEVLASHKLFCEVIVVDDGSTDNTSRVAAEAGAMVIRHPYNIGNGAAVKRGIRVATGDVIVMMDGDGQHNPQDIPRFLEHMPHYEMVVGARTAESEGKVHRNLANRLYNSIASYIAGKRVEDLTSGFRAMNAKIAKSIAYLFPRGYSYPSTATIALFLGGYTVKYIPIKASARIGKSKIRLLYDGLKFLFILARVGTFYTPLRLFVPLGGLIFFPGFFYAIYKLIIGKPWTLPIVISITGGLLVFILGLISEQIALLRISRSD